MEKMIKFLEQSLPLVTFYPRWVKLVRFGEGIPLDIKGSAAETYYRTANYFFVAENYQKALELYEKTINSRPDWYKPYNLKGMTLEQLGEWDKALEFYKVVDKLIGGTNIATASALLNLATINFVIGNFRKTILLCDRVLNIIPIVDVLEFYQSALKLAASAYKELGYRNKEAGYLTSYLKVADKGSAKNEALQRRLEEISIE
jgi:tetratricopeptide (TPR) repeat protein